MKRAMGIVRTVDELGRVVLPVEMRRNLNLENNVSVLEFKTDGEYIILTEYVPKCVFCHSTEDVVGIRGKDICEKCLEELKKL